MHMCVFMSVYMCVVCVCMYVCVRARVCMSAFLCVCTCMSVCVCVLAQAFMYVSMDV